MRTVGSDLLEMSSCAKESAFVSDADCVQVAHFAFANQTGKWLFVILYAPGHASHRLAPMLPHTMHLNILTARALKERGRHSD